MRFTSRSAVVFGIGAQTLSRLHADPESHREDISFPQDIKEKIIPIFKVEENTSHYLCHLVSKHAVFLKDSECLMNFSCPKKYHLGWFVLTDKHCRYVQTKDI